MAPGLAYRRRRSWWLRWRGARSLADVARCSVPRCAALQCLIVAPRLLASIAASGTLRVLKPLATLTYGEPKRALLVTYLFGGALVLIGSVRGKAGGRGGRERREAGVGRREWEAGGVSG